MNLRPYQNQSIEVLRTRYRDGHIRQVLAASTGSGKSIMMMHMIKSSLEKEKRSLFICERRILVDQFSRHLDSMNIDHGVYMANHWRYRPNALVQVASIQTLEKMDSWPKCDVIYVDELHACMRKSLIKYITHHPNVKMCGATATPFHPEIAKHFSSVVSVISMQQLVDSGNLVPFKVFIAKEIDTTGLKTVAGEWKQDDLEDRGRIITGDVVSDYVKLSHNVFGGYRKTICFSCGVAHGSDLMRRFNETGINAIQLSYNDSDEFKRDVLSEFAKPDTDIKVLISSAILERGFDQTDVEHVILARPLKKSFSSHVQMIGRGARPHKGKDYCVIQDHAGNWLRFQDDWNELYTNGITELKADIEKKPKKEPTQKEKEAAKCPKCSALWPPKSDTCSNCGHVRQRKNDVLVNAGELVEIAGTTKKDEKYSSAYKESFYQQLLRYAKTKGYKDGWAYHAYHDKFKIYPPWEKKEADFVSKEVQNFIISQNIRKAKGRRYA